MHMIDLTVEGKQWRRNVRFEVTRVFNMGYTIKDADRQRQHMEEIQAAGILLPEFHQKPTIFALSNFVVTSANNIQVQRNGTSGEVEFSLLRSGGHNFVGVASDHTDRALESHWIPWSKQACSNVISSSVWPVDEVRAHWDRLRMECDVRATGDVWRPYQRCTLGELLEPEMLWEELRRRVRGVDEEAAGMVVLSGTVVSEHAELEYADEWRLRLIDPVLERTISHVYRVHVLQRDYVDPHENMRAAPD